MVSFPCFSLSHLSVLPSLCCVRCCGRVFSPVLLLLFSVLLIFHLDGSIIHLLFSPSSRLSPFRCFKWSTFHVLWVFVFWVCLVVFFHALLSSFPVFTSSITCIKKAKSILNQAFLSLSLPVLILIVLLLVSYFLSSFFSFISYMASKNGRFHIKPSLYFLFPILSPITLLLISYFLSCFTVLLHT